MESIKKYFAQQNIEYFSILSYDNCREINKQIIDRQGFIPKSIVIYLIPYYAGESVNLSRYATSLDYHIAISEINAGLEQIIRQSFPDAKIKGYGDHSPIDERHACISLTHHFSTSS